MGIIESASRLFNLLASKDDTFTRYLGSGLSDADIERIMAPTGVRLPAEVVTFYKHFGLPKGYQYNADQPHFFGIYWMLNLEDAAEQLMTIMKGIWVEYCPEENYPGSSGWFPLLQEDANFFLLDTARTTGEICPILSASEYLDQEVTFVSLQAMFDTLHDWVQEGVLGIESGGVVGDYDGDPIRVAQIAARINPGVECWTRH